MFECDLEDFDEDNLIVEIDEKDKILSFLINFFNDKEMYCGGKIPKNLLLNENNIKLVINSTIENSMDKIYSSIEGHFNKVDPESGLVSDDIKLVKSILDKCSHAKIPKEYSVGILIIYLILCEGFEIND